MDRLITFLTGPLLIALGGALAYLTWIVSPHDAVGISTTAAILRHALAWVLGFLVWVPVGFGIFTMGAAFAAGRGG